MLLLCKYYWLTKIAYVRGKFNIGASRGPILIELPSNQEKVYFKNLRAASLEDGILSNADCLFPKTSVYTCVVEFPCRNSLTDDTPIPSRCDFRMSPLAMTAALFFPIERVLPQIVPCEG